MYSYLMASSARCRCTAPTASMVGTGSRLAQFAVNFVTGARETRCGIESGGVLAIICDWRLVYR